MTLSLSPGCVAPLHGTRWAYEKHHCRCAEALRGNAHKAARWRARQRRDVAPLDHHDIDLDKVHDVVSGTPRSLGVEERRLAITRMAWRGVAALDMANRMGVTERSVLRMEAALRDAGLVP